MAFQSLRFLLDLSFSLQLWSKTPRLFPDKVVPNPNSSVLCTFIDMIALLCAPFVHFQSALLLSDYPLQTRQQIWLCLRMALSIFRNRIDPGYALEKVETETHCLLSWDAHSNFHICSDIALIIHYCYRKIPSCTTLRQLFFFVCVFKGRQVWYVKPWRLLHNACKCRTKA